jgi:hypothetical protein
VYLGHRRFLPANHPVRKKGKHFKGISDHLTKPRNQTGEDVLDMVNDVKVIERIKMPKRGGGELGFSKNKSKE